MVEMLGMTRGIAARGIAMKMRGGTTIILQGPTLTMGIREITMAAIIVEVAISMAAIIMGKGIIMMTRVGEKVLEVLSNIGNLM